MQETFLKVPSTADVIDKIKNRVRSSIIDHIITVYPSNMQLKVGENALARYVLVQDEFREAGFIFKIDQTVEDRKTVFLLTIGLSKEEPQETDNAIPDAGEQGQG